MKSLNCPNRHYPRSGKAAAAILDRQTFCLDVEHTYEGVKNVDMVPNLSHRNLVSVENGSGSREEAQHKACGCTVGTARG